MKLSVSPPSLLAVAVTTSQTLFGIWPNKAAVVAAVELAYESETSPGGSDANTSSLGEECSFAASFKLRAYQADTGVLGCSDPQSICVEDELSSLGGRCTSTAFVSRELQFVACPQKCDPPAACAGLSPTFIANNIGANSCCGANACVGIDGTLNYLKSF